MVFLRQFFFRFIMQTLLIHQFGYLILLFYIDAASYFIICIYSLYIAYLDRAQMILCARLVDLFFYGLQSDKYILLYSRFPMSIAYVWNNDILKNEIYIHFKILFLFAQSKMFYLLFCKIKFKKEKKPNILR